MYNVALCEYTKVNKQHRQDYNNAKEVLQKAKGKVESKEVRERKAKKKLYIWHER